MAEKLKAAKVSFTIDCPECGEPIETGHKTFKPEKSEMECPTCEEKVTVPKILVIMPGAKDAGKEGE
jgi:endogenous inhibitor of DNA gyrase (YacG/DUF329 family)